MEQKDPFYNRNGVYEAGPFAGQRVGHPYNAVLARFRQLGLSLPDRQIDETAHEYIARLDRTYKAVLTDIVGNLPTQGLSR